MSAPVLDTLRAEIVLSARPAQSLCVEELVEALAVGLAAAGVAAVDDVVVIEIADGLDVAVDSLIDRGWPTGHALCAARVVHDLRADGISWSGATLRNRAAALRGVRDVAALLAGLDPVLREVAVLATGRVVHA